MTRDHFPDRLPFRTLQGPWPLDHEPVEPPRRKRDLVPGLLIALLLTAAALGLWIGWPS